MGRLSWVRTTSSRREVANEPCSQAGHAPSVISLVGAAACVTVREPNAPVETAAVPGRLVVWLEGHDVGGVMLTIQGSGISDPQVLQPGDEMFARPVDSTGIAHRFAIVGDRLGGGLFSFAVPDIRR